LTVRGFDRWWVGALLVLSPLWFDGDLRAGVLNVPGFHVTVAVTSGLGALALRRLHELGVGRGVAAVLLLVGCWAVAIGWRYVNQRSGTSFDWPMAVVTQFGMVLLPVVAATFYGTRTGADSGFATILGRVSTIALAAAPLSTIVALMLAGVFGGI